MKANNPEHIDDLLVKLLAGEANSQERALIEEWMHASEENKAYFDHFKMIWNSSESVELHSNISEDAAWNRLSQRIHTHKNESTGVKTLYWLKIAAVLLIAGIAGIFTYRQYQNNLPDLIVETRSTQQPIIDTLSDGSIITLNKNSLITYSEEFKGKYRKVNLTGEAFFKVTPDKDKPFIISVNDVKVTVVGTSFNIKSRDGKTDVIVESGVVKVEKNEDSIELKAGEKVEVNDSDGNLHKEKSQSKLYNYYRSKEFVCDGTPLPELIAVLNEAYKTDISIQNPRLKDLMLTTVFKQQPVEQILSIISQTFNIQVERKGNQFILK